MSARDLSKNSASTRVRDEPGQREIDEQMERLRARTVGSPVEVPAPRAERGASDGAS